MADILKFMHCGCEYTFGNSSGIPVEAFGDGSDGDCTICYDSETAGHIFIPAQEYNFNNLTIEEGVVLHFCGQGVPILRVKNCFINNGTIQLRNPLLEQGASYVDPYLKESITSSANEDYLLANSFYECMTTYCDNLKCCLTLENLSANGGKGGPGMSYQGCSTCGGAGGDGGNAGANGCTGCQGYGQFCTTSGGTGGLSSYANAGGGGGGGGVGTGGSNDYLKSSTNGCNGCDAQGDGIGGDGGEGGYVCFDTRGSSHCWGANCASSGSGGGGGYGYCKGGKGGNGGLTVIQCCTYCYCNRGNGGDGGNSYLGDGGKGGNSCWNGNFYNKNGLPGNGGCSYYGNGGDSGTSNCYVCNHGGCSIYGNGGCVGFSTGSGNEIRCSHGGDTIYGKGGDAKGSTQYLTNGGKSYYGNGGDVVAGCWFCNSCGGDTMFGKGGSLTGECCYNGCNSYGGTSLYGDGGDIYLNNGSREGCICGGNGLNGGTFCYGGSTTYLNYSGIAWGGAYGLGIFANIVNNNGTIYGKGGCGSKGSDGTNIIIGYKEGYQNNGDISTSKGISYKSQCRTPKEGSFKLYRAL